MSGQNDIVACLRPPTRCTQFNSAGVLETYYAEPAPMDLEAAAEIERLRAALAAENEACAKIAETLPFPIQFYSGMETAALARKRIARAIRARLQDGETK